VGLALKRLLQFWLGDGIVLWRTTVIWGYNRVVTAVSSLLFLVLSGRIRTWSNTAQKLTLLPVFCIVDAAVSTSPSPQAPLNPNFPNSPFGGAISWMPLVLSFTINVWAVSLVSYKTWLDPAALHALSPLTTARREYWKLRRGITTSAVLSWRLLLLLVKCGIAYCIVWVSLSAEVVRSANRTARSCA
jgi:hypothetical protein